jgi:hypothetical protein
VASSRTSLKGLQHSPKSPQGFASPIKIDVAQELSERDKASRLQFCNEFLGLVKKNNDIVNTLLMSDEIHFNVSGYVNKQKCHYWTTNNRRELHQRLLHSAKVPVWCAVYCYGIFGPYFFENEEGRTVRVNAERYRVMREIFLALSYILVSKICCPSNKMEQHLTQQKYPCKSSGLCFQVDSTLGRGHHLARPLT